MTLRTKTLIFISSLTIISIISLYVCLKMIILSNSLIIEKQIMYNNLNQLSTFLEYEQETLNTGAIGLSQWDDSIEYINNPNLIFEKENLNENAYKTLKANFIIFLDKDGNIIYNKRIRDNKIIESKNNLDWIRTNKQRFINIDPNKIEHSIDNYDNNTFIYTAQPILTSDGTSESNGTIIVGTLVDEKMLQYFSEKLNAKVKIINKQIEFEDDKSIEYLSDTLHVGYIHFKNPNNNVVATFSVETNRDIFSYSNYTLYYFLITVIVICSILCFTIIKLLDKLVLDRLFTLTSKIDEIDKSADLSKRINIISFDELGKLGITLNNMLSTFEEINKQLEYLSSKDILTDLYNRFTFEKELNRLKNMDKDVTIFVFDVNGLKYVNDHFGHKAGDNLLINVSNILKNSLRAEDKIFRLGGDEFVAIINTNVNSVIIEIYNRINNNINTFNIKNPDKQVSVAIGYASDNTANMDIRDLFKIADNNMYNAKQKFYNSKI